MYITKSKLDKPDTMFKKRNMLKIYQKFDYFDRTNCKNNILKKSFVFYKNNAIIELF